MPKRPLSVVLISYLFIAAGIVSVGYHAAEFNARNTFDYGEIWVLLVRALAIVAGVFTLRGANWARWLLLAWIAYHVYLSVSHPLGELVMHCILLATVAYFLFRTEASAYFRPLNKPIP